MRRIHPGAPATSSPSRAPQAFAAGEAESVEGIEVIDDHTLQVTLDAADLDLPAGPHHRHQLARARRRPWRSAARTSPTGPWAPDPSIVQEWNKGSDITLARNPGYVDPELPYLDEIHVDLGVDENTQVLRLESGEADGVFEQFAISPAVPAPAARRTRTSRSPTSVGPRIFYLALNNDGIFANKDLRQAVAHAMTTDFTAQFGDLAKPWNQLISSTTVQSDPEGTTTYAHDPAAATALLESAGYDGTPGEASSTTSPTPTAPPTPRR